MINFSKDMRSNTAQIKIHSVTKNLKLSIDMGTILKSVNLLFSKLSHYQT